MAYNSLKVTNSDAGYSGYWQPNQAAIPEEPGTMKTRIQTILFLITATLIISVLLFTELVTSATAGDMAAEQNTPNGPTASAADFTINIGINPVGSGQIRVEPLGQSYSDGASVPITGDVSLTPDYDSNYWQFLRWSGTYLTTTSPLPLSASQNYEVIANFGRRCFNLTLGFTGGGGDGESPEASPASSFCIIPGRYAADESITLTAAGVNGWRVAGWSGTLSDTSKAYTNSALMPAANHNITVHYEPICYELITNIDPIATGSIARIPEPNCPVSIPGMQYHQGTPVEIRATADPGYEFINWSGDTMGNKEALTMIVDMDMRREITANFGKACRALTLTHSPAGSGSNPEATPDRSIPECPGPGEYVFDEVIHLLATPNPEWQVESWLGTDNNSSTSTKNTIIFPKLLSGDEDPIVTVNYIRQPTLQFSTGKYFFPENVGKATVLIKRTGSLSETVKVNYSTRNGSATAGQNKDYKATNGTLIFGPSDNEESISVLINNDNIKEGDENFFLTLSSPKDAILGPLYETEIVIQDNEGDPTVQFSRDTYEVEESSSSATITITLFPATANLVYVELDTMAITASSGIDYGEKTAVPVTFLPGETSQQVAVDIWDDTLDEPDETVQLTLSSNYYAGLGNSEAILTINDDDLPPTVQFSSSEYYAEVGGPVAPVTITLSAASALSVTVDYEVIELSVGRQFADTVTFDPGEESKIVNVPIGSYQIGDKLNILLNTADNATLAPPASTILTILDDERSKCHLLTMQRTGYGSLPLTTNINRSLGCPVGHFIAHELIDVLGQPDLGWTINGWHGTLNDNSASSENVVRMPDSDHTVTIYYLTYAYLPTTMHQYVSYFEGPQEMEPNNGLGVSKANGPIRSGQQYLGRFPEQNDLFDIYYFYLDHKGTVQLELIGIPEGRDYNLYLYSASAALKGYSGGLDNTDEHIASSNLEPGIYYIAIHFANGAPSSAEYKITADYE